MFDSATGKYLLIPQGTRAVGMYNAEVTQGQARLQIVWVRLNFPNGQKLNLGSMPGSDHAGVAGLEDQVDRHVWKRIGAALLSSSITVAYEITAPRGGGPMESAVHCGVGEDIVRLGTELAREAGQQPPIITIRQGAPFLINVNKDIAFKRPYDDGLSRDPRRARTP